MDLYETKQFERHSDDDDEMNELNEQSDAKDITSPFGLRCFNASATNSSKLNTLIENLNSLKSQAFLKEDENSLSSSSSDSSCDSSSTASSPRESVNESSLNSDFEPSLVNKHNDLTNNSTLSAAETLLEIKNFFSKSKNDESKLSACNNYDDEDLKEISPRSQESSIDEEQKVLKELQNDFSENGKLFKRLKNIFLNENLTKINLNRREIKSEINKQ